MQSVRAPVVVWLAVRWSIPGAIFCVLGKWIWIDDVSGQADLRSRVEKYFCWDKRRREIEYLEKETRCRGEGWRNEIVG